MPRIFEDDVVLKGGSRLLYGNADGTESVIIDGNGVPTPTGAASVTTLAASGNVTVNTNMFEITAANGNTAIAGTLTVAQAVTHSSTTALTGDVAVNTDKFTVTAANGNTLVAGTLTVTGATTFNGDVTLGAGDDLIGSATSNILINTNMFTVAGATGDTVIAGTLDVGGKITADDVDLASGAVIAGVGTGANGIVLKNLKNATASSLSGTQLDIEIDIAGTPYYFTVYPTKA